MAEMLGALFILGVMSAVVVFVALPVRRLIWWLGLIGVLSFGAWLDSFLR